MNRADNKIRPSYSEDRQVLGKVFPLDTPFTVIVDASERCPARCSYCYRSSDDKSLWGYAASNDVMDEEIWRKAIAQIAEFPQDVKTISLSHHGEPLTNPELPRIAGYIKDSGLKARVSIHTNAILLNEHMAEELVASQIDRIIVSLQGLTAEAYKRTCKVELDYDRLYHNLQYLYKIKTNTEIDIKVADAALATQDEEKLFYEMYEPIADRVFIEQTVPIWTGVDIGQDVRQGGMAVNKFGGRFKPQQCCPLIFDTIVVIPNGNVYPCTQLLQTEVLGNVKESTLVDMWNGQKRRDLLLAQCDLTTSTLCKECYIRQNSIFTDADMIDDYRGEIKARLLENRELSEKDTHWGKVFNESEALAKGWSI